MIAIANINIVQYNIDGSLTHESVTLTFPYHKYNARLNEWIDALIAHHSMNVEMGLESQVCDIEIAKLDIVKG